MQVQEIMTTQVLSCGPNDSLARAAQLMWDGDVGCLPVCNVDGERHVIGVITDRDICMSALFEGKALRDLPVSLAMSKQVLICAPDHDIGTVEKAMRDAQVRRVPVVDSQGALVGIVGLADLAREARSERASSEKETTEAEVGDTFAAICEPRKHSRLAA